MKIPKNKMKIKHFRFLEFSTNQINGSLTKGGVTNHPHQALHLFAHQNVFFSYNCEKGKSNSLQVKIAVLTMDV